MSRFCLASSTKPPPTQNQTPLCNVPGMTKPPRPGVAREILDLDIGLLEVNTQKVRISFEAELRTCVEDGTCETRLWLLLSTWRRQAVGHTKAIEGTNSMIKQQGNRAPSISLELLNARIGLKKALQVGSTQRTKWSNVRPLAAGIMKQCLAAECEMRSVIANQERWTPPTAQEPRLRLPAPERLNDAYAGGHDGARPSASAAEKREREVWAASYSLSFHRRCKKPTITDMLMIESDSLSLAAICVSKLHSCVCLVVCDLHQDGHDTLVVLRNPLQFETSVSMFEQTFGVVQAGELPVASWMKVDWDVAFDMGTGRILTCETEELFGLTRDRARTTTQTTRRRHAAQTKAERTGPSAQPKGNIDTAADVRMVLFQDTELEEAEEAGAETAEDGMNAILDLLAEAHDLHPHGSEEDDDNAERDDEQRHGLAGRLAADIDVEQWQAEPTLKRVEQAIIAQALRNQTVTSALGDVGSLVAYVSSDPSLAPPEAERMQEADIDDIESELILNSCAALGNFDYLDMQRVTADAPDDGRSSPEHVSAAGADKWLESVRLSRSALGHRHAAMQTFLADGDRALGPNLSLVEHTIPETDCISVRFVHWDTVGVHARAGRPVFLDEDSKVIFSVPSMIKKESFADALIVHPDTGVRMMKVRKPGRPEVCQEVLRLKRMLEVALTRHSLAEISAADVACDMVAPGSGQDGLICVVCSQESTLLCCICLLGYHQACSSSSLLNWATQGAPRRPDMDRLRTQMGKLETPGTLMTEIQSGIAS